MQKSTTDTTTFSRAFSEDEIYICTICANEVHKNFKYYHIFDQHTYIYDQFYKPKNTSKFEIDFTESDLNKFECLVDSNLPSVEETSPTLILNSQEKHDIEKADKEVSNNNIATENTAAFPVGLEYDSNDPTVDFYDLIPAKADDTYVNFDYASLDLTLFDQVDNMTSINKNITHDSLYQISILSPEKVSLSPISYNERDHNLVAKAPYRDKSKSYQTKTHYCKYCNKVFTRSDSLKVHMNMKICLKPKKLRKKHLCNLCEKEFSRSDALLKHKRNRVCLKNRK